MESLSEDMQKIDEGSRRTARSRTPTACLQCQKRKQKCSREQPCRHCSRRYPPVECVYTYEGRQRVVPLQYPNRLSVPDDVPASFYTNPKISPSRLPSTPLPHSFSSTVQNYGFNEEPEQNPSQGDMSYMTTFAPSSSGSFTSRSSYQAASSSAAPSPDTVSFPDPEADSNQLGFSSLPQVPTNAPDKISNYDHSGALNLEGERWNQNSNPNVNPGMTNFQSFDQSYLVLISTQTDSSQFLDTDGSQSFHQINGNDGMCGFADTTDMSFPETVEDQNQNRGYEATDDYPRSFY